MTVKFDCVGGVLSTRGQEGGGVGRGSWAVTIFWGGSFKITNLENLKLVRH